VVVERQHLGRARVAVNDAGDCARAAHRAGGAFTGTSPWSRGELYGWHGMLGVRIEKRPRDGPRRQYGVGLQPPNITDPAPVE
jgi:hypothetical protein